MEWFSLVIGLVTGICLGFAAAFLLKIVQMKTGRELAGELLNETEEKRKEERNAIIENLKANFGDISLDVLRKTTEQVIRITEDKFKSERELHTKELDSKKGLIDQQLKNMTSQLDNVSKLVAEFEKDRAKKYGELTKHLEEAGKRTTELVQSTNSLREALVHSKSRGQWGERMADDVLRLAGFIENVNYVKQKTVEESGERPDFTFMLPRGLMLNMDVKFPLDNYLRFLDADNDSGRDAYLKSFLKDVRARIKEVTSRDYINPEQNTVDYVLLFIPNEQVFTFIQEQDSEIMDEGLRKKVILCSPLSLFAVLAVIRAAVQNFALEQRSNRMLSVFGKFRMQWGKFIESLEKVGKRIDAAQKEYEGLITTRRRQLERPLAEIEEMRTQRGLPVEGDEDVKLLSGIEDESEDE